MSYPQYRQLLERLMAEGKTTGTNQSAEMTEYARLNLARISRIEKTLQISPELRQAMSDVKKPLHWVLLTEGWCGDAAQNVPLLGRIAELQPLIRLHVLLRDEHLEIMDAYLTNGGRAIPKLICLDEHWVEQGTWGPRPVPAQELVTAYKANGGTDYKQMAEQLHLWYAKDRTYTMQAEITELLRQWV